MCGHCGWEAIGARFRVKHLVLVLNESHTYGAECPRKVTSGKKVADTIKSVVNSRDAQLECLRVLHMGLLVPVKRYRRKWYRGR